MIKYRKNITLERKPDGTYRLKSDQGSVYEAFAIDNTLTPWSSWWNMQNQSDLRLWQKDILRDFGTHWPDLTPYIVYKRNAGHSQPHDMALARSEEYKVWILSTEKDFWIVPTAYDNFDFNIDDSVGSILDRICRQEIYKIVDALPFK